MQAKRVTTFASLLLVFSLPLVGALLAQDPRAPRTPPYSQQQGPQASSETGNQADMRTFSGKISRSNGKYVLEDPASKTPFVLDDQKTARKYDGKSVVVTGSLDTASTTVL